MDIAIVQAVISVYILLYTCRDVSRKANGT